MDLSTQEGRRKCVDYIESNQNKGRKAEVYKQSEVYNDRIKQFVISNLREQFSEGTVKEMPIISHVNVCKRIVNQQASIYSEEPERDWTDISEDQKEIAWKIYHEMRANKKLSVANRYYKNHKQCLLWMIPDDGKLTLRVLKPYQWDAIPNEINPERADAYIISAYDNHDELLQAAQEPITGTGFKSNADTSTENYKQSLAFKKDQELSRKTYLVWTPEINFVMNGLGEIKGETLENPLRAFGEMPFIEISDEKEFEYWVRQANAASEFTISINSRMSEVAQVVKMQGFSQAIIKGPREMLMENYQIGPNFILRLPVEKEQGVETSFEYANPGSDIAGAISFLETQLSGFLTAEGIDPKTVSLNGESQQFSSGLERLLSLIDKFAATRNDFDIFQHAETKLWELIKMWSVVLASADNIKPELKLGAINMDSEVNVNFHQPEMVMSDGDKLDMAQRKIDLGISSAIREIELMENVSREDAEAKYKQYQIDQGLDFGDSGQDQTEQERSQSEL